VRSTAEGFLGSCTRKQQIFNFVTYFTRMAATDLQTILTQLESKMNADLSEGHPYEALQYVQSFVARKKKTLGQSGTSTFVFHGANQLMSNNASSSAGVLLKWFIEDGAGVDYHFNFCAEALSAKNYCDLQRTIEFLQNLSSEQAYPIVDIIYAPLHLLIAKSKVKKTAAMSDRENKFEALCAKVFMDSGAYYHSFKSFIRLNLIKEASDVLLMWSQKGFASERPLFFGRALLYLLSEGKVTAASELLKISAAHIQDNISPEPGTANSAPGGGVESVPLAVWHLATILTELAVMPAAPRVDKTKLFGHLFSRYGPFLFDVDSKLLEFLTKAGEAVFGFSVQQQTKGRAGANGGQGTGAGAANPMAMLQGLMGGAGAAGAGAGGAGAAGVGKNGLPAGLDMEKMMSMMNAMSAVNNR
jgi:hypothetical protein